MDKMDKMDGNGQNKMDNGQWTFLSVFRPCSVRVPSVFRPCSVRVGFKYSIVKKSIRKVLRQTIPGQTVAGLPFVRRDR